MSTPPTGDAGPAKPTSLTAKRNGVRSSATGQPDPFVVPIVHFTVPENAINLGFWSALIGAVALGAIELPLAALVGAGVLVARHHHSH